MSLGASLLAFVCLAAGADSGVDAGPKQRVLLLELRDDGVGPDKVRAVRERVAAELGRRAGVELVSGDARCDDVACYVEQATRASARFVVYGGVAGTPELTVVDVALFDARERRLLRRETHRLASFDELDERTTALVDNLAASLAIARAVAGDAEEEPSLLSPLVLVGGAVLAAGAATALASLGTAAWSYARIADTEPPPSGPSYDEKIGAKETGQAAVGFVAIGAIVGVIGGGIIAYDRLVDEGMTTP